MAAMSLSALLVGSRVSFRQRPRRLSEREKRQLAEEMSGMSWAELSKLDEDNSNDH